MHAHPFHIVAIGEILWDLFPDQSRFGGAPANFAHHAASLGARVSLISGLGNDDLGAKAMQQLKQSRIDTQWVQIDPLHPTGTVNVSLDPSGHATYHFSEDEAWDHVKWNDELAAFASTAEAVCFGTLAQRHPTTRETIDRFLTAVPAGTPRILDLNLRPPYDTDEVILRSLEMADVLKLNDDELDRVSLLLGHHGDQTSRAQTLLDRFKLQLVAVTCGSKGSLIVTEELVSRESALPTTVRDTVGAGDTFTAALMVGLLKQKPLAELHRIASRMSEFVCTEQGATPELPAELRAQL